MRRNLRRVDDLAAGGDQTTGLEGSDEEGRLHADVRDQVLQAAAP